MAATWAGLYEDRHSKPELRWFWSITVYVNPMLGITTSGRAPSLDQAKAQFLASWQKYRAHSNSFRPALLRSRPCRVCVLPCRRGLLRGASLRVPRATFRAIWLREIKGDGFRVIARKEGKRVRLYSRPGNDLTHRFPLIVEALAKLPPRSCIIDGEAVCAAPMGSPSFVRIRYRRHDGDVFMWAFDLIELNGDDLRRDPLAVRKATLERHICARPAGHAV